MYVVLVLLWVESVLASILSIGFLYVCSSIVESIGVWGCVSDCTLSWAQGGWGVGCLSFWNKGYCCLFIGGPSIHCIAIR